MSSIYSNAYNYLSFVAAGVDPRTGTYSFNISLSAPRANTLIGPTVPVSLSFSATHADNVGFGAGWSIPLSLYDQVTRQLILSTGARHIANTAPGAFTVVDKKVKDLKTSRVGEELLIEHKSGIVEVLTNPSLNWNEWLVSKIYSAEGRVIYLDYAVVAGQRLLREVRDESRTLFTVDFEGDSPQVSSISLWPDSAAEKLVFKFQIRNNELSKITLLSGNDAPASWRFTYKTVDGIRLISRLELPTGAVEQVTYLASALLLPAGAPIQALPAVESHIIFPRGDQLPVTREYSYSAKNYLGYGSNAPWRDDGDNLYRATDDYEYETHEDLMEGAGSSKRIMRRTRRVYNRFHLLIEETVSQNGKTVRTRTRYPVEPGLGFEDQPANFQLPARVEVSYFDAADPRIVRTEVTLTEYDDNGNILKKVSPTGITELFEYYPAGVSDGCPADSFAAVRWLKQKTLIPAADLAPAPTLITRYRYTELPSASPERGTFLTTAHEAVLQAGQDMPIMTIARQHEADPQSPFLGRVVRTVETVEGSETILDHRYELLEGMLCTQTTLSAGDGSSSTRSVWQNRLTGAEIKTVGQLGVTLETTHDSLGRKTLEMLAPKTSSEVRRANLYYLADKLDDPVQTKTVAANGATTLTRLDGLGRTSSVEVQDVDADQQPMRAVYSATYDAFGQLEKETNTDWLDGRPHALTHKYLYDDWGNRCASIRPDGVRVIEQHDPIALTDTKGTDKAGQTVITKNVFGKHDKVERFDRNGKSCGITQYRYDGLGRCVQQIDPHGHITRFTYDFADRLVLTQLPDGTQVKKAFVPHSTENLATHIWVNDYLAGQRTYDGLLRVTSITVGGRTETFTYSGAQPKPDTHVTASGKVISYRYDPAQNNQMIERRVADNDKLSADFRYDVSHAKLIQASSPDNQQRHRYSPSSKLMGDEVVEGAGSIATVHHSSLNGLPLRYVDATGVEQITRYDSLCRVAQVEQGLIKADYSYDAFSRVSRIETCDKQSNRTLTTEIEYDDFDREVRRVLTVDGQQPEELTQRFNDSDKLTQRSLKRGDAVMRDETFVYDARGRLERYECSGAHLPMDSCGKEIFSQAYVFDELDNVRALTTVFNGGENIATYEYGFADKTQLSRVSHSHPDYASQQSTFTYDRDGNQLNDERGRRMIYDDLGRLASVAQEQP